MWRAFGGVTVIEADGLRYILARDRTAVVIDAREADAFALGTLPGARPVPRSGALGGRDIGEVRKANDDGRLPMEDHNTRIIVIGRTAGEARFVAQALAHEAFANVAYFPGTFDEAKAALASNGRRPVNEAISRTYTPQSHTCNRTAEATHKENDDSPRDGNDGYPSSVTAGYRPRLRESLPSQFERRTGAGLFGQSTAVSHDWLAPRSELRHVRSYGGERNPDRSWNVARQTFALRADAHAGRILTTRTEEADKVRGFRPGADDYVTKPSGYWS